MLDRLRVRVPKSLTCVHESVLVKYLQCLQDSSANALDLGLSQLSRAASIQNIIFEPFKNKCWPSSFLFRFNFIDQRPNVLCPRLKATENVPLVAHTPVFSVFDYDILLDLLIPVR